MSFMLAILKEVNHKMLTEIGERMTKTFDHILLLGRPAAGKSEFIDFMEKTDSKERAEEFHLGKMKGMDDFFWLWEKFLEDDQWEEAGYPRIFSEKNGSNYNVIFPDQVKLYDLMFVISFIF